MVAPATLQAIQTHVQNATNELNSYSSNKNTGHLTNANNHIDNVLPQLGAVPSVSQPGDVAGVQDAVVRFRRSAGQHLSRLEKRVTDSLGTLKTLEKKANDVDSTIETQKGRLDQAVQQFVQQSAETQKKDSQAFADVIANAKSQLAEALSGGGEAFDESIEEANKKLTERLTAISAEAETLLDQLQRNRDEAKEIVGIIASTGMAGGYEKAALEDGKEANRWRWIALTSMVGIVGFAIYALVATVQGAFDTGEFLSKVFVSLTFGIVAAYAGREAEKHRRRQQRHRRLHLEFASIDAYLESLPETERNAIKAAIADRIFGHAEVESSPEEPVQALSILEFMKLLGIGGQ